MEQQLRTIPYKLDLHAEQIRGDLRVQQTEVAGRLDRILDKMDTLATREYVYNRAWALLAILVAITERPSCSSISWAAPLPRRICCRRTHYGLNPVRAGISPDLRPGTDQASRK